MLLIITHKTDFTADFIINKLNEQGIAYKRFNCEDLLTYNCSITFTNSFFYSILGEDKFDSVWFRRTKLPSLNGLSVGEKLYILNEMDSLLKNLFSILDVKWMSDPFHVYRAENKLLQLKIANKIGFSTPLTLITNSKQELKKFYNDCNGKIVIKPISQTRIDNPREESYFIFTNRLTENDINHLEDVDLTPCIYQREIEKEYEVRVTVVGTKVFSAAIDSQKDERSKVDWRRKRQKFRPVNIPEHIKNLCIEIVAELSLAFGAIDLIKGEDGNYTFLEINPNGQWAWIESQTGLKISDAIIEELITK